jgi:hypothetical protein
MKSNIYVKVFFLCTLEFGWTLVYYVDKIYLKFVFIFEINKNMTWHWMIGLCIKTHLNSKITEC